MKTHLVSMGLTILLSTAFSGCKSAEKTEGAPPSLNPLVWEIQTGLEQPESAYFCPETQTVFVSNVSGEPGKKDGKGFISQFSRTGQVLQMTWFKGLHAPKGMRSYHGKLFVSDIDRVVAIDIKTARTLYTVTIKDAKFLNDIAVDSEGTVYVSDMAGNKIYKIKGRKFEALKAGFDLESPNGLLIEGDVLYIASWGKGMRADFSTEADGNLHSYHLKTGAHQVITPMPLGHLDGLERLPNGNFVVSDWIAGKVFNVQPSGASVLALQGFQGAADLGFIPEDNVVVVPRMNENKLSAYKY